MKNIHVLPTDKPSRLIINTSGVLTLGKEVYTILENKQNIYITNDEEVKDGEYGICLNLVREGFKSHQAVFKMDVEQRQAMNELGGQKKAEVLKIILTTDPDLIKYGVQAIDDEFLEWFVKNTSCEEVEVKKSWFGTSASLDGTYKIIVPKEEPKQETLEEVAERFRQTEGNYDIITKIAFEEGAKWQQQQNKNLYSEQTVTEYAYYFESCYAQRPMQKPLTPSEWFEQFKKK